MHATNLIRCALVAPLVAAGCAGAEPTGNGFDELAGRRCGELPAAVQQRFDAMRGPLGCAPSVTPVADPPGGCAGVDDLLASARREYAALWARGGCGAEPPDLTPVVTAYLDDFAAHHRFVAHRIQRDGFTIAAREFGAAHAGRGPLIVLMHGFPDSQHLYDRVAPLLAETQHVVTFDFVGWGDSTRPPAGHAFTFADLRKDLEAVLAHFGATRVVPVVHDASGWPGIDWALDHPESVTALVLLNTAYHPIAGTAPPYVIRALSALDLRPAFLTALGTDDLMGRAVFRAQVSRFFSREAPRHIYLPVFEHDISTANAGLVGLTATLLVTARDRAANVPRMQAYPRPVLVAFGADDPFLNPTVARGFAAVFPGSRLELIRDAGHYVQLDQPGRVAELIRAAARGNLAAAQ
jgi:pimeloyl-ACP methyl ester carboxylesterase